MDPRKRQQFFPLYNSNAGFFIAVNERVYCAVQTKYSNIIQVNFSLKGVKYMGCGYCNTHQGSSLTAFLRCKIQALGAPISKHYQLLLLQALYNPYIHYTPSQ
jgi:hypothetical protein